MKKSQGAVTETGRYRCVFAALAMIFFVAGLIGGAEAFTPTIEMDDVECAQTLDAVLVESRVLRDDNVRRVVRRQPVIDHDVTVFFPSASIPADSQVLSLLRDGGRQRATHPTGPPIVLA